MGADLQAAISMRLPILLVVLCVASAACAQDTAAVWAGLRAGGHVALVRHAGTVGGAGDPPGFRLDDCATQRNLTLKGRGEARRLGELFRIQEVPVGKVLSSQWCRCIETITLMGLGTPELAPTFNNAFTFRDRVDELTAGARALISGLGWPRHAGGGDARREHPAADRHYAGGGRRGGREARSLRVSAKLRVLGRIQVPSCQSSVAEQETVMPSEFNYVRRRMLAASALAMTADWSSTTHTPGNSCQRRRNATTVTSRRCGRPRGLYFKPSSPQRADLVEPNNKGRLVDLNGQVLTRSCRPVARALVDLWHCDEWGEYDNKAFRYRGHLFTDGEGRYRFRTILPALYPGRTRHYHVKVQAPDRPVLTTQLYFPADEAANRRDGLFRRELLDARGRRRRRARRALRLRGRCAVSERP